MTRRPSYVITVIAPDTRTVVCGPYLKQSRAEEDAARLRRGLKGHGFAVTVTPLRFADVATMRWLFKLDEPAEIVIVDPRSPSGFRSES